MCDFHSTAWRMSGQDIQVAHLPSNSHSGMIDAAGWRVNEPNRKTGENCAMLTIPEMTKVCAEAEQIGAKLYELKKAQSASGNFEKEVTKLLDVLIH